MSTIWFNEYYCCRLFSRTPICQSIALT